MASKSAGLTSKLLRVTLLQIAFISVVTILGVYAAAIVVEDVMMREALEGEADHFWALHSVNPQQPLPNTDNLVGFFAADGDFSKVPAELRSANSGFGRVEFENREPLVLVSSKNDSHLYLVFDEQSVKRLSFYFGVVPLTLALVVIYFSAWMAFRQTQKAVSPVVQLANTMRNFDYKSNTLQSLDSSSLPISSSNDEVSVLTEALQVFTSKISELIDREKVFTRDASHELRTPLTVIQGSTDWLLSQAALDDRSREVVMRIRRTSRDMTELVHALLFISRGEKQAFELVDLDVNEVLKQLCTELDNTHNSDRHVSVTITEIAECSIFSSEQALKIVSGNLLRNAFNYTRQGKIVVTLNEDGFAVTNKGEGVVVEEPEKLFEAYYRGDNKGSPGPGYGVGLDIVKRICDFLAWEISAEYSPDTGMTFTVSFNNA